MGVFDKQVSVFAEYDVELQFRDRVIGGVPQNPEMVEGWLRAKALTSNEEELRHLTVRTMKEMGIELPDGADESTLTMEQLSEITKRVANERQGCAFKRDAGGLYIEDRQLKAAIKETTNILFAGESWGLTGKGPRSFVAERVFVEPGKIHLLIDGQPVHEGDEGTGVMTFVGHVSGPKGDRSVLGMFQYVEGASVRFRLKSTKVRSLAKGEGKKTSLKKVESDEEFAAALRSRDKELGGYIDPLRAVYPEMWVHMQDNGLGALRSQSFGKFDVVKFEEVG